MKKAIVTSTSPFGTITVELKVVRADSEMDTTEDAHCVSISAPPGFKLSKRTCLDHWGRSVVHISFKKDNTQS